MEAGVLLAGDGLDDGVPDARRAHPGRGRVRVVEPVLEVEVAGTLAGAVGAGGFTSLGLILASLGCGLDFAEPADLELFFRSRHNLFAVNARLNPVLSSVIVECTELNRHRRAQDLTAIVQRLETYREQRVDFDTSFLALKGFKESPVAGKRFGAQEQ